MHLKARSELYIAPFNRKKLEKSSLYVDFAVYQLSLPPTLDFYTIQKVPFFSKF